MLLVLSSLCYFIGRRHVGNPENQIFSASKQQGANGNLQIGE
jgi:hypothetical protein